MTKEEILKSLHIYPGFSSTYTYDGMLQAMEEYASQFREGQQGGTDWEGEAKEAWRKIQIYKEEGQRYKEAYDSLAGQQSAYREALEKIAFSNFAGTWNNSFYAIRNIARKALSSPVPSKEQGEEITAIDMILSITQEQYDEDADVRVMALVLNERMNRIFKIALDNKEGRDKTFDTLRIEQHKRRMELEKENERLKAENEGHKEIARARGEAITELQNEIEKLKW